MIRSSLIELLSVLMLLHRGVAFQNQQAYKKLFLLEGSRRRLLATSTTTSGDEVENRPAVLSPSPSSNREAEEEHVVKHQIRWKTAKGEEIVFEAHHGELLRTAALLCGIVSPHNGRANLINCRGLGTCGTCAVEIQDVNGGVLLKNPGRNAVEKIRLSIPPGHDATQSAKLRLACQFPVYEDLTVMKRAGFWGQYPEMASEPSKPTMPLGEWEFVLDKTSPKRRN
jgi:ferredoxin